MSEGLRVFDLEQPRTAGMPVHPSHRPGYSYFLHRHHEDEYGPERTGPRTERCWPSGRTTWPGR